MINQLQKNHKNILKGINELRNNHSKLVGEKVKISNEYRSWLKANLDQLTDGQGSESLQAIIDKKKNLGVVVKTQYDLHDGVSVTIKFEDGSTEIVGLTDIRKA